MRSQSAISLGGFLARMAHARLMLLGVGKNAAHLGEHLQEARKQIGSGMASVEVRMEREAAPAAVEKTIEQNPVDMVVVGWRPMDGVELSEQILSSGSHHLLLAAQPDTHMEKALVCVSMGEPGKDDVMFAGRLLRHLGAKARLFSVMSGEAEDEYERQRRDQFMAGGAQSLELFGVPTECTLKIGDPQEEIIEEIRMGNYDLVVLGAPLSVRHGHIHLRGVVEGVMKNAGNCSLLIIRSNYLGNN